MSEEQLHTLHSVLNRVQNGENKLSDPELARKHDAAFGKYIGWLTQRCQAELRSFGRQEVGHSRSFVS